MTAPSNQLASERTSEIALSRRRDEVSKEYFIIGSLCMPPVLSNDNWKFIVRERHQDLISVLVRRSSRTLGKL